MTLTEEAQAALAAEEAAAAAAAEAARKALRQAAVEAVRAVLTRADGTQLTLGEAGLAPAHADVQAGLVVYSDGEVALAAVLRDGRWRVFLAELVDEQWTVRSERLGSLADLARAMRGTA